MTELIFNAIIFGLILSFLLGPAFFILLETSINQGIRAAIAFDLGVLSSDITYIALAYWGSQTIQDWIIKSNWPFWGGGIILLFYSATLLLEKFSTHHRKFITHHQNKKKKGAYLALFSKGFLLNIINPGVFIFWVAVTIMVSSRYGFEGNAVWEFFVLALGTFAFMDGMKILLAKFFKHKMTSKRQFVIRKILGVIILVFGVLAILKGTVFTELKTSPVPNVLQEKVSQ